MFRSHCLARTIRLTAFAAFGAVASIGNAAAADKIIFSTDFGLYGRHAYYFVAMEKG
jgi:hypothetical protein